MDCGGEERKVREQKGREDEWVSGKQTKGLQIPLWENGSLPSSDNIQIRDKLVICK